MLFLQSFPTRQVSVSFPSFSVSKTKAFQWCWVSLGNLLLHHCRWDWQAVCPGAPKITCHVSGLPACSSWSELPVLCIENAESLANGSSEPCLLEKVLSLGLERWFRLSEWPCLCFFSPRSTKGGVPISLVPHMLDGLTYYTTKVWSHSLARRSVLAGSCGEGQARYISDKAGKCLSLTGLAGALGDYTEMKEMIL